MNTETQDIELITHYPLEYAQEAMVLLRRLRAMKLQSQESFPALQDALNDSQNVFQVISSLERIAFPNQPETYSDLEIGEQE